MKHKARVVTMFLEGQDVSDISTYYGVHKRTVERVLREALVGLARLNQHRWSITYEASDAGEAPAVVALPDASAPPGDVLA